jgi:hypothetical protein
MLNCLACDSDDLTYPTDPNMNIDYIVCQDCGCRVERESWDMIHARLKPLKKCKAELVAGIIRANNYLNRCVGLGKNGITLVADLQTLEETHNRDRNPQPQYRDLKMK